MTASFSFLSLSSIALLAISLSSTPSVSALTVAGQDLAVRHAHVASHLAQRDSSSEPKVHKKKRRHNKHKRENLTEKKKRCVPKNGLPPPANNNPPPSTNNPPPTNDNPPPPPPPPAPKPTSTSKKPTSTPAPPPPPATTRGKRGLAWPTGNTGTIKHLVGDQVKFIYTWSPWNTDEGRKYGLRHMPMLWGPKQLNDWKRLVKPGYANIALGFNEPDRPDQANLSPQAAVDLWWQAMEPLVQHGYTLVSPGVASSPEGKAWLREFFNRCQSCTVPGLAVHWYGTNAKDFINYVTDMHNSFGKRDVYVTEFACTSFGAARQPNRPEVKAFMQETMAWLDSTPWVKAYMWFGAMLDMYNVDYDNRLINDDYSLTDLGFTYAY